MVISIEGMDGTGKSCIAKKLAKLLNYHYTEKSFIEFFDIPIDQYLNMCSKIGKLDDSIKALFYGFSNLLAKKLNYDNIIIDKHMAYTYFYNSNEKNQMIFDMYSKLNINPDLTILIYASPETRIRHIKNRNENDLDLLDDKKMSLGFDKMYEYVKKYNLLFLFINSDNYTNLSEIVDRIYEVLIYGKNMTKMDFIELLEKINNEELYFNKELEKKITR